MGTDLKRGVEGEKRPVVARVAFRAQEQSGSFGMPEAEGQAAGGLLGTACWARWPDPAGLFSRGAGA